MAPIQVELSGNAMCILSTWIATSRKLKCRGASKWHKPPGGIRRRSTSSSRVARETDRVIPRDAGKTSFESEDAALETEWPAAFELGAFETEGRSPSVVNIAGRAPITPLRSPRLLYAKGQDFLRLLQKW